jgi:hypothetical protein
MPHLLHYVLSFAGAARGVEELRLAQALQWPLLVQGLQVTPLP